MPMQMNKIIALNQLVAKLHEGHAIFQTQFDRILGQHIINRDMSSHIGDKVQKAPSPEPLFVVDQACGGW